jgi:hypothetical protein
MKNKAGVSLLVVVLLTGCTPGAGGSPVNRTAAREAVAEANKAAAEAGAAAAAALAPDTVLRVKAATGHCRGIAEAAERTMTARQMGAPMADVMEAATKAGGAYEKIVVDAYDWPLIQTDRVREQVIAEFQNAAYRECITSPAT